MKKKKYRVSLSDEDIEFLRDCINFRYEMSGYDDSLNWEQREEDKETINEIIRMEEKLKNVVCPPIKYNFKEPSKLDKLLMGILLK